MEKTKAAIPCEGQRTAKNRIPVYDYRNQSSHSFFLSLFLRAGCMYEKENECGITHFLEHTVFRNINHRLSGELYQRLDELGIEFNASTYAEMVQFYISGPVSRFRSGVELLTLIFEELTLPVSELDTERRRVKAEIREVDDSTAISAISQREVWRGTSLAGQITGTASSVSRISRARLEEYRRRVFTPDNLFVYATGALSDEDISYLTDRVGEARVYEGERHDNTAPVPADFMQRGAALVVKNAPYTKLRFSFDVDMNEVSSQELDLLYDTLLGGYSSRFFIELSEKRGIIYDVTGSVERYANVGAFSFSFELRSDKIYEAISEAVTILLSARRERIAPERMMKAGYVTGAEMLLDDQRELNFTFAYDNHILNRGYKSVSHRAAAYAAVTPEALSAAAEKIFRPEGLVLVIKGNAKKIDREKILSALSRLA